jgi:hypothetical protein
VPSESYILATKFPHIKVSIFIWLAVVGLYVPGLLGPLLLDDIPNLVQNPLIAIDGRVIDDWRAAALSNNSGLLLRPISMLTFAVNYAIEGYLNPFSLKLANLIIHLLIGALIYAFTFELARAPVYSKSSTGKSTHSFALIVACLWLIHPLHVSTVLYAVQRMAQLSAFFVLLGLWVYLRYRNRWALSGASHAEIVAAGLWLLLITALASLSKENGLLLPWLLAVVEVTLFRGVWSGVSNSRLRAFGVLCFAMPFFLIALGFAVKPEFFTAGFSSREFTLNERLMTQARVLWSYVGWLMLPDIQSMGLFHDDFSKSTGMLQPVTTLLAVLAWSLALCVSYAVRLRYPLITFSVLFFLVAHSMESSFLPLEMVFEHRNYLPSVGICLLLGWALCNTRISAKGWSRYVLTISVFVLLSAVTFSRAQAWGNQYSLADANVRNHPGSLRANIYFAQTLMSDVYLELDEVLFEGVVISRVDAARQALLRAFEKSLPNLAPPVLLWYLDQGQSIGQDRSIDWLAIIENSTGLARMQASDIAALYNLLRQVVRTGSPEDILRVGGIIERAIELNPKSVNLALLKIEYLLSVSASREQLNSTLDNVETLDPGNPKIELLILTIFARSGDHGGMYLSAENWLRYRSARRHLPLLRNVLL